MSDAERVWPSRLRWRLKGALQWPAFALATLLDAVILDLLPPLSTTGLNFIEGLIIATFGNLAIVGIAVPFLTKGLMQREPDGPDRETTKLLMQDRLAAGLLAAGVVATLISGIANRPTIISETEDTEEAARVVKRYVENSNDGELKRNLETANTARLSEGFFRICLARDERDGFNCFFVDTNEDPTTIKKDPSAEPNEDFRRD